MALPKFWLALGSHFHASLCRAQLIDDLIFFVLLFYSLYMVLPFGVIKNSNNMDVGRGARELVWLLTQ